MTIQDPGLGLLPVDGSKSEDFSQATPTITHADPTKPQRLSFYVPHDSTTLNMGKESHHSGDRGLTGNSHEHVHWHAAPVASGDDVTADFKSALSLLLVEVKTGSAETKEHGERAAKLIERVKTHVDENASDDDGPAIKTKLDAVDTAVHSLSTTPTLAELTALATALHEAESALAVVEAEATEYRTFVTLGRSSESVTLGLSPYIKEGYGMITDGRAWQQSREGHLINARVGPVFVQSDEEGVAINAASEALISSKIIGITATSDYQPKEAEPELAAEQEHETAGQIGKKVVSSVAEGLGTLIAIGKILKTKLAFVKAEPEKGEAKFAHEGVAAEVFDFVGETTVAAVAAKYELDHSTQGKVEIFADTVVGVVGNVFAGIYGHTAAAVSSSISSSVSAIGWAGLKAIKEASVFGALGASLSSIKHTSVEATSGKVHVTGGKGVHIAGLQGNVIVASRDKDTEVWSEKGHLHLYSREPFVLADRDYGVITRNEKLFLGALENTRHLKHVEGDENLGLELDKYAPSAQLVAGDARIELRDGVVTVFAKQAIGVKMDAMGVSIAGGTLDILN